MRRLFPPDPGAPDDVTAAEAYRGRRPRPAARPWVALCMVASLDGTTVVKERSHDLSSPADQAVLSALRQIADLIIVGAGTVRAEGYGPPRKPGQRIGVITRRGEIDLTTPLFTSGAGFLIMPEDAPLTSVDSVRAGVGRLDLPGALAQLDADVIQAEGGPRLNGALLDADLIDELNLAVAPRLAGGNGPRLTTHAADALRSMRLAHVLEDDGFLFTRYVRDRDADG
ncbi:MAG: dihydrofolate reductase family protein [Ilumatobacteraceae bacterium]